MSCDYAVCYVAVMPQKSLLLLSAVCCDHLVAETAGGAKRCLIPL